MTLLTHPRECIKRAKERGLPLVRIELNFAHVRSTPLGQVSRATVISEETAEKIMKLIDADQSAKR